MFNPTYGQVADKQFFLCLSVVRPARIQTTFSREDVACSVVKKIEKCDSLCFP